MERTYRSHYPASIVIDGQEIQLKIARLDVRRNREFERLHRRAVTREADRLLMIRRPGEEQARVHTTALSSEAIEALKILVLGIENRLDGPEPGRPTPEECVAALRQYVDVLEPTDQFVVDDEEIRRRRWCELDDAERAKYDALCERDDEALTRFLDEALGRYITVLPGQLRIEEDVEVEDGQGGTSLETKNRPVRTGADLGRCFGALPGIATRLARLVLEENRVSETEKNASRSRSASPSGSATSDRDRTQIPAGQSQEPTAASAASEGSAMSEDATVLPVGRSGGTVTSRSQPVQSAT